MIFPSLSKQASWGWTNAVDPSVWATAVDLLLFYDTFDIVAELGDDLDLHRRATSRACSSGTGGCFWRVEVGRETVTGEGGEVFALEGEVLQCRDRRGPIDDALFASGAWSIQMPWALNVLTAPGPPGLLHPVRPCRSDGRTTHHSRRRLEAAVVEERGVVGM